MRDLDNAPGATDTPRASSIQTVERERAVAFGEALRTIMQRQDLYIPLTGTFLLPQLYERLRMVDGGGIPIPTLRAYLRGDALPSDSKVRLLADGLGLPRGVLLFASGYLTAEDLPNYPGPHASLESIEADIREVETMPLSADTKQRILHELRTSARILTLIQAERAQQGQTAGEDERELLIEQLISIWESPPPPPPPLTSTEEAARQARATSAPASTPVSIPAATATPPVVAQPSSPAARPSAEPVSVAQGMASRGSERQR